MEQARSAGRVGRLRAPLARRALRTFGTITLLAVSLAVAASSIYRHDRSLPSSAADAADAGANASVAVLPLLDDQGAPSRNNPPGGGPVSANPPVATTPAGAPAAGSQLSRAQAIALVQGRYRARVVRTSVQNDKGHRLYVFRLLSENGKVWSVRIDAQTGAEVP